MTRRPVENILMTCSLQGAVGGVEVVFRDIIHWLRHKDRTVHLVYQAPLPTIRVERRADAWGQEAAYCPMPSVVKDSALAGVPVMLAYLPVSLFHLVRMLRRDRIDLVSCHYLAPYFLHLVIAGLILHIPVIISVHGADIDEYHQCKGVRRWLLRLVIRGATTIVACSDAMAKDTIAAFPWAVAKVTYVHNGLDLRHFGPAPASSGLPERFVLCVCRHVRKKGIDVLLHAFARVAHQEPDVALVLVGRGPLLDDHRALAATLGIDDRVIFAGGVSHREVPPFFAASSVFVLPSRAEPFGVVLLEASYYRKPIVAARVGGVPEIITDRDNGLLVEPDDPAGLAARMLAVLRDPALAAQLAARAHETLLARFLWRDRIDDYIAVFEGRVRPASDAHRPDIPLTPRASARSDQLVL